VHPSQISQWKLQLLERAEDVFSRESTVEAGSTMAQAHIRGLLTAIHLSAAGDLALGSEIACLRAY
jgi:hypothetical protein